MYTILLRRGDRERREAAATALGEGGEPGQQLVEEEVSSHPSLLKMDYDLSDFLLGIFPEASQVATSLKCAFSQAATSQLYL